MNVISKHTIKIKLSILFNLELPNKFSYLFHEKSAKKILKAAVSSSTQQ